MSCCHVALILPHHLLSPLLSFALIPPSPAGLVVPPLSFAKSFSWSFYLGRGAPQCRLSTRRVASLRLQMANQKGGRLTRASGRNTDNYCEANHCSAVLFNLIHSYIVCTRPFRAKGGGRPISNRRNGRAAGKAQRGRSPVFLIHV